MLTLGEVFLDPAVVLYFAIENFSEVFGGSVEQVVALGHDSDADHVSAQRNIPKPALVGEIGDRSGAFVETGVSHGALEISPNRDLLELGIALHPLLANGGETIPAGCIDNEWSMEFEFSEFGR